ncbi:MAG: amino acid permease [Phycisphaerales bacterium]|jgi:amino acid transporter/nucleotide-binding universal stress UspA family protein|nr:amino acid permease [Phycisphaeraceae bacterium]
MSALVTGSKRPRELSWYHAGPLLFGDWGTSRLYVLGLAFYYTGHASPLYLAAMSVVMIAVAWAYSVICRVFPDGGGVYAAARQLSPTLSVIGATLLLCDYIVTASLSAIEGFHYLGAHESWVVPLSIACILLIGVVNWLGARSAGRFALVIAVVAIGMSALVALLCLPLLKEGIETISTGHSSISDPWTRWENFIRVILALSGLEAVANMTGLMKQPVARTSKFTIFPVLVEVVALNLIFGIALNALPALKPVDKPHYVQYEVEQGLKPEQVPDEIQAYRNTAMKELASHATTEATGSPTAGRVMGIVAGIIFGLLLISAVNTAIMAMVAVQYSMAMDRELPGGLTKLNYSGVPWIALILACIAPGVLLLFEADVKSLGELYAIGVVGAITINVLSCAINRAAPIGLWERRGMWVLGVFMAGVFVTICIAKHNAFIFATAMVGGVLVVRFMVNTRRRMVEARALPVPAMGWMAELTREPTAAKADAPRIMLAARGRAQSEYAVNMAKQRGAMLFAIYVRTLRLLDVQPGQIPQLADDPSAQEALGTTAVLAHQAGVPFVPIYVTATDIAEEILDYTVTFGCDTLIMGKTKRSLFARKLEGDVVTRVAELLPEGVSLRSREAP